MANEYKKSMRLIHLLRVKFMWPTQNSVQHSPELHAQWENSENDKCPQYCLINGLLCYLLEDQEPSSSVEERIYDHRRRYNQECFRRQKSD